MARGAEEAASEYRQALEELKDNNKMQINLMTILADDYNSFSQEIIGVIVRQVEKVPVGQKMPVMYVMDSILKNITDSGNYKDHIERNMYKVFLHVFETGDERTRLALHKLRQTWTGIFQRSTLYKIDLAVHQIDPAWPVITPQPSSASLNVGNSGPRACAPGTVRPAMSAAPARPSVHLNPHFFQKTASSAGSTDNEKSHLTKPTCDPRLARSGGLISGRTLLPNKAVPAESWVGVDRKSSKRLSPVPVKCEAEVKVVKQEQKPLVNESGDVDERFVPLADVSSGRHLARRPEIGDRSPSNGILKRKCDKEMDMDEGKKVRIRSPPVSERVNRPTPPVIKPTNDLGSHAFITTVRPSIPQIPPIPQIAQAPAAVVPVISDPSTSALLPAAGICSSTSNVGAFTSVVTTAASFMTTVPGTSVSAGVINPDFSTVSLSQHMAQPSSTSSMLPPVASVSRPIISTDTPKLEGIPANNRIFVDGRAYEVSYINDVPVIERNSLPHRIYFTGSPRNVIIDGKAHLMAFGEEKRVLIDGEEHVLKFGAPSRELYMGNYPFKGAFGGPPIFATINGVRHEIRLSGPPPEVKIEPDPCYELLRHMPRVGPSASGMGVSSQRSCADQGADQNTVTMDVKGLLAKLQKSGFLTVNVNNKKNEGPSVRGGSDSPNRSPTPPIPSEHRGEVTERLPKPPTDLMKFSMRALKIRYDSVVESLHQIRHVCPNCGLRFAELRGEKYQRHLDWHFRENLKSKERPRYRSWYLSLDEWLEFSEEEQLEASTSSGSVDANDGGNTTNKDAHAQDSNVPSDAAPAKECGVCKEKFEEYWDEDDDLWKLKDCVVDSSGSIFHTGCILDASMVNHSVYEDVKNEENCDKKSILLSVGDSLKRTLPVTQ